MALVVIDHTRLQVVVAHKVGHFAYLVLKSLLAGYHGWARWVQALHDGVQFLGSLHARIVFVPCFLHLIAYAPNNDRWMIAVSQHHIGDVLMGILIIEGGVIARLPFVESLIEYQETERIADVQEFW